VTQRNAYFQPLCHVKKKHVSMLSTNSSCSSQLFDDDQSSTHMCQVSQSKRTIKCIMIDFTRVKQKIKKAINDFALFDVAGIRSIMLMTI
jgi:hypothetical protein